MHGGLSKIPSVHTSVLNGFILVMSAVARAFLYLYQIYFRILNEKYNYCQKTFTTYLIKMAPYSNDFEGRAKKPIRGCVTVFILFVVYASKNVWEICLYKRCVLGKCKRISADVRFPMALLS